MSFLKLKRREHDLDMCSGPVFGKVLLFVFPLILSSWLQLLYNAADLIVVGRCAGKGALAAVGATTSLNALMVHTFVSVAIGASVVVARYVGAKDSPGMSKATHTSVLFGVFAGIGIGALAFFCARIFLSAMGTPADIIDKSVLYLRIIALGMPFVLLYNFAAAVLRAVGDTKKPMYILAVSGLLNVGLNLFFVLVVGMDVAGVAIATAASQAMSSVLAVIALMRRSDACRLELRKLRIHRQQLIVILKTGIPAGIQAILFNISNVLIQSTVNSFGSTVVAGNTAAMNIETFMYTTSNSMMQTSVTFCGQNVGARKYSRLNMILRTCALTATGFALGIGGIILLLRYPLLSLYNSDRAVQEIGVIRFFMIIPGYFCCSVMESIVGGLRSIGRSISAMMITVIGVCGMRLIVIFIIFPLIPTLQMLFVSYPVSWLLTGIAQFIAYSIFRKKLPPDGVELKM
ncbi:MAG: MATE family efflux transporter [Oscillospiraceae bacterium]|nr:MATE family efflux transporter [Oscillospiraceae bacterium]